MNVSELMTKEPGCCTPDTGLHEVGMMMVEHDCGEIPVCDGGGRPIGVVTDRDIVCRLVAKGLNPLESKARDCMSEPVITVTEDTDVADASRLMEQYQVRRLPAIGKDGKLCGMVSQADLAKKAPRDLAIEVVEKVSKPKTMAASAGGIR